MEQERQQHQQQEELHLRQEHHQQEGQEDEDRLVKPKAYVVLKEGQAPGSVLEAEIKQFVKDKIAAYKYPRWIEFVTELPKTATGKIQRFKLRQ